MNTKSKYRSNATFFSAVSKNIVNKSSTLTTALIILLLAGSCQKEPIIRFGFDCDFEKNSQGITIMNVGSNAKSITLTGEVALDEGEVMIELENPTGEIVFSGHLVSPIAIEVNEIYQAVSGNWKLKYKSLEGIGTINLHLNIVN